MYRQKNLIEIDLQGYDELINIYGGATTVSPCYLDHNDSGWYIEGEVVEDYYEWVNQFAAFHEDFGFVMGDFEQEIYASSVEAFEHFLNNHSPDCWDYMDI